MNSETGGKDKSAGSSSRRSFLLGAAGVGMTAIAPGVVLYAAAPARAAEGTEPASSKVRWGLLIDLNKCPSGCTVCVQACAKEIGWKWKSSGMLPTDPQWIRKVSVSDPATGHHQELPVMCQHCAKPPCVDVCPTGASFKRADGIVLVDRHICIGCRYCMMACPYKARSLVDEPLDDQKWYAPRGEGTAEACTLCVHRIDEGRIPACVEACAEHAGGAMVFGDLNDANSDIAKAMAAHRTAQIRSDLCLDPAVHYVNLL